MATIVNLGKLRLDWRGDYSTATPYVANDVVTYRQQQWVCTQPTTAASFTANQTGTTLNVTAINAVATNIPISSTATGTTVTVASTQGLTTGNTFVVSGNAGGGLTAGTYYVGAVLSNTTLTLSSTYANAIAGTYISFTGYTFGSSSVGTAYNTGTSFTAYGTLAVGQTIANTGTFITTTGVSGTGTTVTVYFAAQSSIAFQTGTYITITGMVPNALNGTWFVTNASISSVSFLSNVTQGQVVAGQITVANPPTITALGTGTGGVGTYTVTSSLTQVGVSLTALSSSVPSATSGFWTQFTSLFNNTGTWLTNTAYNVGDVAVFSTPGSLVASPATIAGNYTLNHSATQAYYCTTAHTSSSSITPANLTYWAPVNRQGTMTTSVGGTTGSYNLGVYSNQNYQALVLPNRGIAYDATTQYYGGTTKNTTDSSTFGYVTLNGQAVSWGTDVNGSNGMTGQHGYALNALTFPFYDFWRSGSNNAGAGVHVTPDNGMPRVIQWEKCYDRNLVLTNSGEVFAWGYGGNGENGNGGTSNVNYPVRVGGPLTAVFNNTAPGTGTYGNFTSGHAFWNVRIKRISTNGACGFAIAGGTTASSSAAPGHCLAIDENGVLWAWGNNAYGQLGIGAINSNLATTSTAWPQPIPASAFATAATGAAGQKVVACWAMGTGYAWSYAVTADGNLWVWGYNASGQLGIGNTNTVTIPTLITSVAGTGQAFGSATIGNIIKIQALDNAGATTNAAAAILTSTGLVFVTGNNSSGWMGFSTTPLNVWSNIATGPGSASNSTCKDFWLYGSGGTYATCMMRDSITGVCWTSGANGNGQLGVGGTGTTAVNVFAPSKMNIAGQTYNLINVKQLAFTFNASSNLLTATVVLDNGIALSIGSNTLGQGSIGLASTNVANADANTVEIINSYVWQMVRAAPNMQGVMADVMGFGGVSSGYNWLMWKNADGRVMLAGPAQGSGGAGTGSAVGQYVADQNATNVIAMTAPLVD